RAIVETVKTPLVVLDESERVLSMNPACERAFDIAAESAGGQPFRSFAGGSWRTSEVADHLRRVLAEESRFDDVEATYDSPSKGPRSFSISGRRLPRRGNEAARVLVSLEDVTDRKLALLNERSQF